MDTGTVGELNEKEVMEVKLSPSVLGTKDHWEMTYEDELKIYQDTGVVGESWFGKAIEKKIIEYIQDDTFSGDPIADIADIGCGNGSLLIELAKVGYRNLTALDYSEKGIELMTSIVAKQELEQAFQFMVVDMLKDEEILKQLEKKFEICIDKGTYDAISLMPIEDPINNPRDIYLRNVCGILQDRGGSLILASCNWTRAELLEQTKEFFQHYVDIETSKFSFGGSEGSNVTVVVLIKLRTK